jgi:hypothetical protein
VLRSQGASAAERARQVVRAACRVPTPRLRVSARSWQPRPGGHRCSRRRARLFRRSATAGRPSSLHAEHPTPVSFAFPRPRRQIGEHLVRGDASCGRTSSEMRALSMRESAGPGHRSCGGWPGGARPRRPAQTFAERSRLFCRYP